MVYGVRFRCSLAVSLGNRKQSLDAVLANAQMRSKQSLEETRFDQAYSLVNGSVSRHASLFLEHLHPADVCICRGVVGEEKMPQAVAALLSRKRKLVPGSKEPCRTRAR